MFRARGFVIVLFLLLAACGRPEDLPPAEVIHRAVIKSNSVESVAVSLSAHFSTIETTSVSGSLIVQSVIRSGGQAWSADTSFNVESVVREGHERASGRLVAVSPGTGRTYLRLESAEGILGQMLRRSFTGSTSGWMAYGNDNGSKPVSRHTPDPVMMSKYAEALSVTENLGTVRDDRGRALYHYRVRLLSETLSSLPQQAPEDVTSGLSAHGELWIDSTDFSLRRVIWNVEGVPSGVGPLRVRADALFTDYDSAEQIHAPIGTSATLPVESIFAIFSS